MKLAVTTSLVTPQNSPFPLTERNREHLQELYAQYGIDLDALEASLPLIQAAVDAVENSAGMSGEDILALYNAAKESVEASGGLIEVLISPIVEACPTDNKASVMSLLHSFYCWGQALVVILTTVFFALAGSNGT